MIDRIKQIMENENLTPAKFSDRLQINRANISHILNGRNNPSLDIVTKILSEMPYISTDWLLNGTGEMYKAGFDIDSLPKKQDLFSQPEPVVRQLPETTTETEPFGVNNEEKQIQRIENRLIDAPRNGDKKISQIIIYYSDKTFETFVPQLVK